MSTISKKVSAKGLELGLVLLILLTSTSTLAFAQMATPPPAITGLTATDAHDGKVNLTWNSSKAENFAYYAIYVAKTEMTKVTGLSPTAKITDVTVHTYQVTGLEDGTKYYFAVTAVDTAGNEDKTVTAASTIPTPSIAPTTTTTPAPTTTSTPPPTPTTTPAPTTTSTPAPTPTGLPLDLILAIVLISLGAIVGLVYLLSKGYIHYARCGATITCPTCHAELGTCRQPHGHAPPHGPIPDHPCGNRTKKLLRTVETAWRKVETGQPRGYGEVGAVEVVWERDIYNEWEIRICGRQCPHRGQPHGDFTFTKVYSLERTIQKRKTYSARPGQRAQLTPPPSGPLPVVDTPPGEIITRENLRPLGAHD